LTARPPKILVACAHKVETINKRSEVAEMGPLPSKQDQRVAEVVIDWYEEYTKKNPELEDSLLDEISVNNDDGKIEMIMLARMFSQYRLREENALRIWKQVKSWFLEENYRYRDIFKRKDNIGVEKLDKKLRALGFPVSAADFITEIGLAVKNLQSSTGEIEFQRKSTWKETTQSLTHSLRGTGIRQKAFWIFRVLKQIGEWEDIPGEFCCVSDVHVKAFLRKFGFVTNPDENLFLNSSTIWKYFNEPFEHKYYDIPVFRFARTHGCVSCNIKECSLSRLIECSKRV